MIFSLCKQFEIFSFFCKTKGHVLDIKNTIDDCWYVVLNYRSFVFYIHFLWKKVEQVIHFMMNDVQIHVLTENTMTLSCGCKEGIKTPIVCQLINLNETYSKTCLQRPPLGPQKSGRCSKFKA
jgi:hypothetical protein